MGDGRGYLLKIAAPILLTAAFLALAYSYFIEPYRLVVKSHPIDIEGWDREFDGFRAVLISDIHGGSRGGDAESIKRIVSAANEADADAVFLLGDYVSQQRIIGKSISERPYRMLASEIADLLSGLQAKHGVFAVLGNHDAWYPNGAVATELRRVGITLLDGGLASIRQNGRTLRILGLRDHQTVGTWSDFSADAKAIINETQGRGNIIVLEHSPDVIEMITGDLAISDEVKVMFAGHTHGGQVWLPILGYPVVPSSYGQKYASGHMRERGLDLFVTSGTGTSILPFRFLVPPEIVVVTIKAK